VEVNNVNKHQFYNRGIKTKELKLVLRTAIICQLFAVEFFSDYAQIFPK